MRLSFWDTLAEEGGWVRVEDGGVAPQAPVRIQGAISDNTAVVNPRIAWIGERNDVDTDGFPECTNGEDEFFECEMFCEEAQEGFFECAPLLPSRKLIRGDRFLLTFETAAGETYELEVQVSEAQDLLVPESTGDPFPVLEDYRILRLTSLTEDGNPFLWSLYQRKTGGGPWLPLRSGDFLALESGDDAFQLAVEEPGGIELKAPPTAAWRSLVKWNEESFLNWDASTGTFEETFQLFDPRVRDTDSGDLIGEQEPPVYRYLISAEDVPDQKTGEFRYTLVSRELHFEPERAVREPDLEVDGEEEERIETSEPAQNATGSIQSFSGEVRALVFRLSEEPGGDRSRFFSFEPEDLSLLGDFTATLVYVSDWDGDGIVDEQQEEGGIPNLLEVLALDMQGNWTRKNVPVFFLPSTKAEQVPELQILEVFPVLDEDRKGRLPFGEALRVRARAADDRGQPSFSAHECTCSGDDPLINEARCACEALTGVAETPGREDDWVDLNAGGAYPRNPWEWISMAPSSRTEKEIGLLLAKEKVEDEKDLATAKFSGLEIDFEPQEEEEAYDIEVSLLETRGPNVILSNLENGAVVDPEGLLVQATIYANFSELNRIQALRNGRAPGEGDPQPTFDSQTGVFLWDLQGEEIKEGDRLCVGAFSVTGHATLNLLEFASVSEGLLLGITVTSDPEACAQRP